MLTVKWSTVELPDQTRQIAAADIQSVVTELRADKAVYRATAHVGDGLGAITLIDRTVLSVTIYRFAGDQAHRDTAVHLGDMPRPYALDVLEAMQRALPTGHTATLTDHRGRTVHAVQEAR